jgi:uncharacterized protein (TIGR03086 family)
MELDDALEQSFLHTQGVIAGVDAAQYGNPTPCDEWTVRELLEHTIGVVAGLAAAASGSAPTDFELGSDPAAQFATASAAALAAWRAPGVFDRVVDGGAGPMPGRVLASINLLDTTTHAWDLATATGQPAKLPDDIASAALAASHTVISPETRPGRFGPAVEVAAGADPTDQLVAFLGRRP